MPYPNEATLPTLQDANPLHQRPVPGNVQYQQVDPDNPAWGVFGALMIWIASIFFIVVMPVVFLMPYASYKGLRPGTPNYAVTLTEFALNDKTAVLLQILSLVPSHLLTFVLVWILVTRVGKQSFWPAIGWGWPKYFPRWISVALSVMLGMVLFVAGNAIANLLGADKPTQLEQIINSSMAARYTIAFLAVFTAPFVEEFIYRGVLYSALRRDVGVFLSWILSLVFGIKLDPDSKDRLGVWAAVVLVLVLFTVIHVPQYWPNLGVIAAVALLSFVLTIVRAFSGRLLPCIVIHLVFNGIQAVLLIVEPYTHRLLPTSEPSVPPVSILLPLVGFIF